METDKDAVAVASVAITGVFALGGLLATAGKLDRAEVTVLGEIMHASIDQSQASKAMRANLRAAVAAHVASLLRQLSEGSATEA